MIIINVYFCKKVMKIYVEVEYKVRKATATAEKYLSSLVTQMDVIWDGTGKQSSKQSVLVVIHLHLQNICK